VRHARDAAALLLAADFCSEKRIVLKSTGPYAMPWSQNSGSEIRVLCVRQALPEAGCLSARAASPCRASIASRGQVKNLRAFDSEISLLMVGADTVQISISKCTRSTEVDWDTTT
jgi:hypothetical protein